MPFRILRNNGFQRVMRRSERQDFVRAAMPMATC